MEKWKSACVVHTRNPCSHTDTWCILLAVKFYMGMHKLLFYSLISFCPTEKISFIIHTGSVFSGTVAENGALRKTGGWSCTSHTATATLASALSGLSDESMASKLMTYADLLSKSNGWFKNSRTWYSFGVIWNWFLNNVLTSQFFNLSWG